jgi:hypothetical protein
MPSTTAASHLTKALAEMKAERGVLIKQLKQLDTMIATTEAYTAGSSRLAGSPAPAARPAKPASNRPATTRQNGHSPTGAGTGSRQPDSPVQTAILSVIRENGKSWSAADLTKALTKRGILTGGEHATDKVRKSLSGLRGRGVVVSKRQGDGKFAPTVWKLAK